MQVNLENIPIVFCFDNNYVTPAAVTFYSLLENANRSYRYNLYVMHSDITEDNIKKLLETIEGFSDFATLHFINMSHRFDDLWQTISTKGHFTKEVMYKVLLSSIFPQYDKIIVSDVDVVFLGDISSSYIDFDIYDDYFLAGVKIVGKIDNYMNVYQSSFSDEEIEKLKGFCGGYIVFNLHKLRIENKESDFIECFKANGHRINQMEQDILNLCCYPKIKYLSLNHLICSYTWDLYQVESDFENDLYYTREQLVDAMNNPIQLHYATSTKPWKNVDCTKSEEWFKYIVKTPFLKDYLKKLPTQIVLKSSQKSINAQRCHFIARLQKIAYKLLLKLKCLFSNKE